MRIDQTISAVVTGGASGLGEAAVRALASHGVRVAIFDLVGQQQKGDQLAAEVNGIFCPVDVATELQVDAAFRRSRAALGQERVLVNCAGIGNAIKTVSRDKATGAPRHFPVPDFERVIRVNLVGTFQCIAKSAAGMLTLDVLEDGERGVIVNTSSIAAEDGQVGQAAYAASKAAIVGMTLPMARDLMGEGIRINTILPGAFDTPLLSTASEEMKAALAASVPFPKRLGNPREFAEVVLMLIKVAYLNGEKLRLDGGLRMSPR